MNAYVKELEDIKQSLRLLIKKVNSLESKIAKRENNNSGLDNSDDVCDSRGVNDSSENAFKNYLIKEKHLEARSVSNYVGKLRFINKEYKKYTNYDLKTNVFDIDSLKVALDLKEELFSNVDFVKKNLKSHHSYSAAINNLIDYVSACHSTSTFEIDD